MKKILSIAMLVMIFILSSCSLNEGSLKESSSEDLNVAPSQQEETTHAEIEGEQGSHEGTESQSPSIQAKDIQVEPIALIEELENVHSQREGYPYIEITSASADNIFFIRGAIPTGDVYGTVDGLYRYDMKTKEIVPEIEDEAKKRVMKVVLRDQFKYILKIDVERNEFILLKEDLSAGQVKELIQDLVLDPYTHSPTLIEKGEDIYFIYPHRDEESSYLSIYNLAIDEKKPIFKEAFRVTNFESAREGVDDLGIMMTDASDHSYIFLSYPQSPQENEPKTYIQMIDGEKYQRISSQFLIEKAFLSGETLLLVITQSDEEAMQNELQKYFSLTLDELVQDEIDREHFESRIQDLSYDIAYPMPIGHGAFLALISSENKLSLSLIQVNKKHALTSAQLLELEKKGRFIPINEKECLLHLASYKEDHALNAIYLVRWRRDQSLGSR